MKESPIKKNIRIELSKYGIVTFNCVTGTFLTMNTFQPVKVGLEGHSDLYGTRCSDGKSIYIETKASKGGVKRKKQIEFINTMKQYNALAGFANCVEDALIICEIAKDKQEAINLIMEK